MKITYGTIAVCGRCGQDIQWLGRADGWRDRGNNRSCVAYRNAAGELVKPKASAKHNPKAKP